MKSKNYFKWLERTYRIEINQNLRNAIVNYFGENLNIYTEQEMYEQSQKVIHNYQDKYYKNLYKNY